MGGLSDGRMNDGTGACTRPPAGWTCSRGDGHEGPCAARPADDGTIASGPAVISSEERRLLAVGAVEALKDRGIADISMNTIFTTLDLALERLGVDVSDDIYDCDGTEEADGTPVCRHCGGRGVEYLTEDERQFFAYMAAQRWRTVAEKDTSLRDQKRARWQDVAVWFDPNWKPE